MVRHNTKDALRVPPKLSIFALGPVQVFRDQQLLSDWAYLDSEELLFYLLKHTRKPARKLGSVTLRTDELHGKTREQIGLVLWPDASTQQLVSKLKSRLYDLRRVLGEGDWIIFEDGQYKFNATLSYSFDVEDFEEHVAKAESLHATSPAQAITSFQQAVHLYRGDFLADLRQRRRRKEASSAGTPDGSGREWHITEQEELQAAYLDVLQKLGRLLSRAGSFAPAAEAFRLALAKDDYDDAAHRGLMHSLALQGKRSQALEHYRKLLKRRSDIPPGPEIVELAERLKRGEELAPRPAEPAAAPDGKTEAQPESPAPFQVPADLPRFVGRELEANEFREALTRAGGPRLYCFAGMGGIGKTSLAVHLAHSLRDQFPDGVLWAHVSTSEPLAILDSWARAFGCDFSGLPDLESRAAALRAVLADKKVLIILDDVWSARRARTLLVGGAQAAVLFTSRDFDVAQALDAQIMPVPVFAAEESHELLARIVGSARLTAEPAAATEICELVGHLPLALGIAAYRLASRPRWSLGQLVERLRVQHNRLAELKIGDLDVRASFGMSWEVLEAPLRRVFALLGVFQGRAFQAAALADIAELEGQIALDQLDSLVALSMLSVEDSLHYRQHPVLADFAREHLEQAEAADARMAQYYLRFAVEQRQNYLALEQEWDNLAAGIGVAHREKMWQALIDYGDVLTNAWFARGRFTYARQAYPLVCAAARELEEQDAYIAATINWGRACIEQGDYAEARERLLHAVQTCREVNDEHGLASALFQLTWLALERSDYDEGRKLLADSQRLSEKLGDRAGVGVTLMLQARIHYRHYDYLEVQRLATQALDLLRNTDKHQHTIEVLRILVLAASHQGQYELADQYCQEAIALCEATQNQAELPSVLFSWMQLCWRRGDFDSAKQHGERSIELFKQTGDRKSQAYVLEYLMRVYLDLKTYDLAEARGAQSMALLQELQDDWGIIYALRGLGKLYALTDRQDEARQVWSEALRKAEGVHHPLKEELQNLLGQL